MMKTLRNRWDLLPKYLLVYLFASILTTAGFFMPIAKNQLGLSVRIPFAQDAVATMFVVLSFSAITLSLLSIVKGNIDKFIMKCIFVLIGCIGLPLYLYVQQEARSLIDHDIDKINRLRELTITTLDKQSEGFQKHNQTDALRDIMKSKQQVPKQFSYSIIKTGGILTIMGYAWFFIGIFCKDKRPFSDSGRGNQ